MKKLYYIKVGKKTVDEFPTLQEAKKNLSNWHLSAQIWSADIYYNSHDQNYSESFLDNDRLVYAQ